MSLRVQYPAGWSLDPRGQPVAAAPSAGPADRRGSASAGAAAQAADLSSRRGGSISAALHPPSSWIVSGGPMIGLGASTAGSGSPLRFDAAVGYEFGVPSWVVGSLLLDSDFRRRLAIAPGVELASPYVRGDSLVFPSLAVGIGAPVRVFHQPAAGLRGQATISFPSFGLVGFFDWYPALGRVEPVVLVRASL
jgi:hypothetical protein